MEDGKGLKTQVEEITKWKEEIEAKSQTKKGTLTLPGILSFVISGGLVGYFSWLFLGITWGIILGGLVGSIALAIVNYRNSPIWNLPFKARFLGRKKKREGYVVVMKIGLNKAVSFEKCQIDEGVYIGADKIPHKVRQDEILIWKNKIPMIIQPEWAEEAWNPNQHYTETQENGTGSQGYQYIMNFIYKNQIKEKKEVKMGLMIVGGLAVIGLIWYLIKSGAFS